MYYIPASMLTPLVLPLQSAFNYECTCLMKATWVRNKSMSNIFCLTVGQSIFLPSYAHTLVPPHHRHRIMTAVVFWRQCMLATWSRTSCLTPSQLRSARQRTGMQVLTELMCVAQQILHPPKCIQARLTALSISPHVKRRNACTTYSSSLESRVLSPEGILAKHRISYA